MARTRLFWCAGQSASVLHHVCAVPYCLLGRRSILLAESLGICCWDCTERAGSIVWLTGVPSIPRWQDSCRNRWMAAGCVCSGTWSTTPGNDVVDLCTGGIGRADRIAVAASLHSRPRSRAARLIGKIAYDKAESPAIF